MTNQPPDKQIRDAYAIAKERYNRLNVDTDMAMETLVQIPISLHCWQGDYTTRLVLLEELKGLPFGAVWDHFCAQQGVPVGISYMDRIKEYEKRILSRRG